MRPVVGMPVQYVKGGKPQAATIINVGSAGTDIVSLVTWDQGGTMSNTGNVTFCGPNDPKPGGQDFCHPVPEDGGDTGTTPKR